MKQTIKISRSMILCLILFVPLKGQSWTSEYGSSGTLAGWSLHVDDRYRSGMILYGNSQLLIVRNSNSWAALQNWSGSSWSSLWSNGGGNYLGPWEMHSSDEYLIGNFDDASADQLLAVKTNGGAARLLMLTGYSGSYYWSSYWNNGSSQAIGNWTVGTGDKYIGGNLDGSNSYIELLCVNPGNGWAMLLSFNGSSWTQKWANSGDNTIGGWTINGSDKYSVGDFDGDGITELMCVYSGNGWAAILKFNGSTWGSPWANSGNGWIGPGGSSGWQIGSTDAYTTGNFEGTARTKFLSFNYGSGWAMVNRYASVWNPIWSNSGSGALEGWTIRSSDKYLVDYFTSTSSPPRLLMIDNQGPYVSLMKYNPATFSVSISGPSEVFHPEKGHSPNNYQWSANQSGGYSPISYVWKKNGYQVGTSQTYAETYYYDGAGGGSDEFTLRIDVTDGDGKQANNQMTVTEYHSGGGAMANDAGIDVFVGALPEEFGLKQNYPNPFNPETRISYALPEPADVAITISDLLGREVIRLASAKYSAGYHTAVWRGTDGSGNKVGSGIYFYRFMATGESGKQYSKVMKMLLAK